MISVFYNVLVSCHASSFLFYRLKTSHRRGRRAHRNELVLKNGGKPQPAQTSSLFTVLDERRLPLPSTQTPHRPTMSEMYIIKRDGRKESVHFDKITSRISKLCYGLNPKVRKFFAPDGG